MKLNFDPPVSGLRVTIMGLGLHGGGAASARFFASRGARVTVTDLNPEEVLRPSLETLGNYDIRYTLGGHQGEDFSQADLVIKNPGVPRDSPWLPLARRVETDLSVFLGLNRRRILGVTGSKGKSTTASAIYHVLRRLYPDPRLGGNITLSPLDFLSDERGLPLPLETWNQDPSPVVLELSSWQLGDLAGRGILRPQGAVITNILRDHQDRYSGMEAYVADKEVIFKEQEPHQTALFPLEDSYGPRFYGAAPGQRYYFSSRPMEGRPENPQGWGAYLKGEEGFLRRASGEERILPEKLALPGFHNRLNLLAAGGILALTGEDPEAIVRGLGDFQGVEHRLEFVREWRGIAIYNDSAATLPEAAAAALLSFSGPLYLITGGTDKNLDFSPLLPAINRPRRIYLLAGSAQDKYQALIKKARGLSAPVFESLEAAFEAALKDAEADGLPAPPGGKEKPAPTLILSPGCASFGMFLNEFDRGRKFKALAARL
ncbi:MAG: UDP-N-acetylmuramoyl-L-alanine--D-glutamate ligase [Spirochaetales bacterium]|nr:UDP-N-acetylmuramoyl-L-alanine--D-glutamate ligase [Spirochaetales bacterium]